MIRSLIDIYRHEGYLPDCRMNLCEGFTQGGSNADVVLADAFLKGLNDSVDWETGYEAVVKNAEGETAFLGTNIFGLETDFGDRRTCDLVYSRTWGSPQLEESGIHPHG